MGGRTETVTVPVEPRADAERARCLKVAKTLAERVLRSLDRSRIPCGHCGLMKAADMDHWESGNNLEAVIGRLEKVAKTFEARGAEAPGAPR